MSEQIDFGKICAVALDLDGTLLNNRGKVSSENKEALFHAHQKGIQIIISSGRPLAGIQKTAEEIHLRELEGYIVGANGGSVVRAKDGYVLHERTVSPEVYQEILEFSRGWEEAELLTYNKTEMLVSRKGNCHSAKIAKQLGVSVRKMDKLTYGVSKFVIAGEDAVLKEKFPSLKKQFGARLKCVYGGGNFIEIMPYGVSKAEGLKVLLAYLNEQGICIGSENLMCCGDSANDIEMLQYAGLPVVMENANRDIWKYAAYITASNEAAGVAEVLKKVIQAKEHN